MPGVLQNRVVEIVLVPIDIFRPVLTVFTSVNPTTIILGLNDKDAEGRHYDVVNL